ncbi:MAG: M23 family metallopeptidase, partial [Corynebacterium sp.]
AGAGAGGGWMRPGPGPVTSRFGPRWGGSHSGIDLAMPIGTPLRAPFDGRVLRSGMNTLAGRTGIGLMMALANGYGSYFGHLSRVFAADGQSFKRGQILALSGNTGRSTGPHLHFEVNRGNFQAPINPTVTGLFDGGGALEHGRMALNLSGKPEAVLTNSQWQMLESLASTGGFPDTLALRVGEREFTGYVEDIAYGEDRAYERVGGAWT